MPLNLAEINQQYMIQKICGDEEQRHYLETLGFVENAAVRILSVFFGNYIVMVKESKIAIGADFARMIDRKSTRQNSSHGVQSRMPSSA